jgi:hypothetical protein
MHVMRKLALLILAACSSSDGDPKPMTDAAAIDAPPAAACTGAVYDPCTAPAQCMSGNCRLFAQDNLQVCTQTCTPGTACPMAGSTAITCNNSGFCKPPAANNCTR